MGTSQFKQHVCIKFYQQCALAYSILTSTFTENREKIIGYAETAAGIGLFMGPIIGSTLYTYSGYLWCYMSLAIFLFASMIFISFILPDSLNRDSSANDKKEIRDDVSSLKEITTVKYSWFLFNRRAIFCYVSVAMVMIFVSYKQAFMPLVLEGDPYGQKG